MPSPSVKKRVAVVLIFPPIVGVLLLWLCVSLVGVIAAFVSEHRFFGLPVYPVMFVEALLAWLLPSVLVGLLLGGTLGRDALVVGVASAGCAFIWVLLASSDLWLGKSVRDGVEVVARVFSTAMILMFIGLPGGVLAGLRLWRPDTRQSA